jgi:hypothetical protein
VPLSARQFGPDLVITGSVATLICRRIARDVGAGLSAWQFTAIGAALIPAQFAVATLGAAHDWRARLTLSGPQAAAGLAGADRSVIELKLVLSQK